MVKRGRIVAFFLLVTLIAGTIGVTSKDIVQNIKLGLDLQGGFEVLYKVEPTTKNQEVDKALLKSTVSALNERVNVLGVSEPNIQIEGDRIRVQLAGVEDQSKARELLSTQAALTFRDVNDKVRLKGSDLKEGEAKVEFDQKTNQPIVSLTLKNPNKFAKVTKDISQMPNFENRLVIWLDYEEGDSFQKEVQKAGKGSGEPKYISAPSVTKTLSQPNVTITGMESVEEAKNLAELLNAGSLPVKLTELYSTSVGAKFGQDSLDKTVFAGAIGIAIIFLFMILYYRIPGIIAAVTLSIYLYLILLVFDWIDGVLTLPGIAALILGVGMAVDANIITYERIKEELRAGKSIQSAFKAGNRHSLSTILDANITTILAAAVLFMFGTSSVKGFALVLIISIVASFLTAVYGSRLLLGLWVKSRILNKKPRLFGVKEDQISNLANKTDRLDISKRAFKHIDFVKNRKKFFTLSTGLIGLGLLALVVFHLNLGIDFASGTRVGITANQALEEDRVKSQLESLDLETEEVVVSGDKENIAVARYVGVLSQEEIAKLKGFFKKEYGQEPNVGTVDPTVGRELAKNALYAIAIASIGITLYVTIRFELSKAIAAIVALLHDAFFIIAVFSILQIEVDLTFIAAILTIVGYSINDTIVTFDRIRENSKYKKIKTFADLSHVVNVSLIQTLARSINTVLTVVFAAAALLIFGSEAIRNFSFALLIGLIAGTYSSLFIAAQLWIVIKDRQMKKQVKKTG